MTKNSEQQKKLAAELAVALSQFMQQALPHDTDAHGFVFHSFQNPFDENCHVLWSLGVAWAAHDDNPKGLTLAVWEQLGLKNPEPSKFRFADADSTRSALMKMESITALTFDRLMKSYLRSMCEYSWQGSQLPTDRKPFTPDVIFAPQIRAMSECGFVEPVEGTVRWADSIAPAMMMAGLWNNPDGPASHALYNVPAAIKDIVVDMIEADNVLEAIAVLRHSANLDITQAKHYVDVLRRMRS